MRMLVEMCMDTFSCDELKLTLNYNYIYNRL